MELIALSGPRNRGKTLVAALEHAGYPAELSGPSFLVVGKPEPVPGPDVPVFSDEPYEIHHTTDRHGIELPGDKTRKETRRDTPLLDEHGETVMQPGPPLTNDDGDIVYRPPAVATDDNGRPVVERDSTVEAIGPLDEVTAIASAHGWRLRMHEPCLLSIDEARAVRTYLDDVKARR